MNKLNFSLLLLILLSGCASTHHAEPNVLGYWTNTANGPEHCHILHNQVWCDTVPKKYLIR